MSFGIWVRCSGEQSHVTEQRLDRDSAAARPVHSLHLFTVFNSHLQVPFLHPRPRILHAPNSREFFSKSLSPEQSNYRRSCLFILDLWVPVCIVV